ncbi:MAG: thiamine-phosphate synthase family protein, partial [Desulfovibrionaceae bacterium]
VTDWLAMRGHQPLPYMQPRVKTKNNHGTGCTLSAAIAAHLGKGLDVPRSVRRAQEYLNLALRAAFDVGAGSGPPNHLAPLLREQGRQEALDALDALGEGLEAVEGFSRLIPQGIGNAALMLPWAHGAEEVVAFSGGLVRGRAGRVAVAGGPRFGASAEAAAVLLAARKARPDIACTLLLGFSEDLLLALKRAGITTAVFDRAKEPRGGGNEAATLEWGVLGAIASHPDSAMVGAVYDRGAPGVGGGVRLLGRSGLEVAEVARAVLEAMD